MKKMSSFLFIFLYSFSQLSASETVGLINSSTYSSKLMNTSNTFSSSTSSSFVFWNTKNPYNVTITDTELHGFLWGPMLGYISLNCQNTSSCASSSFKVSNNDGKLTGYAWGENAGWISFSCDNAESNNCASNNYASTSINSLGEFIGYAWSENFGWIEFNCSNQETCVSTDWRKLSSRVLLPVLPVTSSSGSYVSTFFEIIKQVLPISSKTLIQEKNTPPVKNLILNNEDIKKIPPQPKEKIIVENLVTVSKVDPTSGTDMRHPICTEASCAGDSLYLVPLAYLAPNTRVDTDSPTSQNPFNQNKQLPVTTSFATIFIAESALKSVTENKSFLSKVESGIKIIGINTFHLFTQFQHSSQKASVKTSLPIEENTLTDISFFKKYIYNFLQKTVNK